MNLNEIAKNAASKSPICPFLGLKDDSSTIFSFPSHLNHCFHAKPVLPVKLEFQGTHCLTSAHTHCEEFIRTPDNPLLPDLRYEDGPGLLKKFGKTGLWILLVVIVIMIFIVWQVSTRGLLHFRHPGLVPVSTMPVSSATVGLPNSTISSTQLQGTPPPTIPMTDTATPQIQTSTPPQTPQPASVDYMVLLWRINVYAKPDPNSTWVRHALKDEVLHVVKIENSWAQLLDGTYVFAPYLQKK